MRTTHTIATRPGSTTQRTLPAVSIPAVLTPIVLTIVLLTALAASPSHAQQLLAAYTPLPDAPNAILAQQAPDSRETDPPVKDPGIVSGIVSDIRGGLVQNAEIKLIEKGHPDVDARQLSSGAEGQFSFTGVAAGTYNVVITSPGLETFLSPSINLKPGEHYELQEIALPIASATTTVNVEMTEVQVADEEIKIETQQRVLGIVPNFYTSFLWNAAPLNTRQKARLSLRANLDPEVFLSTALVAGIEQAHNTFPEYGDDAEGYGKRFGAAYADVTVGRTLGRFVFPSLFRQDPRYFFMGPNHSTAARLKHALLTGLVARGDNGKWQPNYSHMAGNAAAGAISTLYRPKNYGPGELAGLNAAIGIGGGAIQGLVREFLWPHLTTKVPSYAKGKPAAQHP